MPSEEPVVTSTDTPPAPVVDTPAPTPDSDEEIVAALTGEKPKVEAPAAEDPKPKEGEGEDKWPETDPDGIKSRNHYLKEVAKLREREKALEEKEAQAAKKDEKPEGEVKDELDPDDEVGPLTAYQTKLDPEDFEHESEKVIVKEVTRLTEAVRRLIHVTAQIYQTQESYVQVDQNSAKDRIAKQMEGATTSLKESFGVEVSLQEVAQALQRHGKAIMEKNGNVLPDDAARQAWIMDNLAVVMEVRKKAADEIVPPVVPAPVIQTNTTRVPTGPTDDDEEILAALLSGKA